jgi:hypothetical protein
METRTQLNHRCLERSALTHLGSTPTGHQPRVEHHVSGHAHRIRKVPVDLVEDILGRATEENRAGFGGDAVDEEREVPGEKGRTLACCCEEETVGINEAKIRREKCG